MKSLVNSGDPNFGELEPHWPMAQTAGRISAGGVSGRRLRTVPRIHRRCVKQDLSAETRSAAFGVTISVERPASADARDELTCAPVRSTR
jgi:hypothetical protein